MVKLMHGASADLNESPSEKEGKCISKANAVKFKSTSMKAPPKRKGNRHL